MTSRRVPNLTTCNEHDKDGGDSSLSPFVFGEFRGYDLHESEPRQRAHQILDVGSNQPSRSARCDAVARLHARCFVQTGLDPPMPEP